MHVGISWEIQKNENVNVGWKIILKFILDKYYEVVWTGIIRLRIGSSGGLL
jgi:hypothetical protein